MRLGFMSLFINFFFIETFFYTLSVNIEAEQVTLSFMCNYFFYFFKISISHKFFIIYNYIPGIKVFVISKLPS